MYLKVWKLCLYIFGHLMLLTRPVSSISCVPCDQISSLKCPNPPKCCQSGAYEAVSLCGCCKNERCAKAENESCGGSYNMYGSIDGPCAPELHCLSCKSYDEDCPLIIDTRMGKCVSQHTIDTLQEQYKAKPFPYIVDEKVFETNPAPTQGCQDGNATNGQITRQFNGQNNNQGVAAYSSILSITFLTILLSVI